MTLSQTAEADPPAMIVFDLECGQGHRFEGWFDDLEAFESQNQKDLVSCPYCNDTRIQKVLSPVSVRKSGAAPEPAGGPIDYRKLAKEIVDYVHQNFEDVGSRFAGEALKMHYGVSEKRNIRGSATNEEEKTLKEEGINFFKLPVPDKKEDDKKN